MPWNRSDLFSLVGRDCLEHCGFFLLDYVLDATTETIVGKLKNILEKFQMDRPRWRSMVTDLSADLLLLRNTTLLHN